MGWLGQNAMRKGRGSARRGFPALFLVVFCVEFRGIAEAENLA